jgi:hypothetical protein
LAAVEGLQTADDSAVTWSVSDFTLRSLHPALRSGIQKHLDHAHAS